MARVEMKAGKKLMAIATLMRDAHTEGMIDDTLFEKLVDLGLTELRAKKIWEDIDSCPEVSPADYKVDEEPTAEDVKDQYVEVPAVEVIEEEAKFEEKPAEEAAYFEEEASIAEEWTPQESERMDGDDVHPADTIDPLSTKDGTFTPFEKGWGFLWCIEGGEMHAIEYNSECSPWAKEVDNVGQRDEILVTYCTSCRSKSTNTTENSRLREPRIEDCLKLLKPRILSRSEPREVALLVAGKNVEFATMQGRLAYVDAMKAIQRLGPSDTITTIDMDGFREGKRAGLLLSGLRGGLI